MRLVSRTDSAGWLRVPASTSRRPYIHGTSLPPLCSQSTNQKCGVGSTPPVWQESQRSDPVIPSTQPTLQKHAASRRCSNTPLAGLVACALRATSVYKAASFIHCQWGSHWIYRPGLDLCLSVCHALTPRSFSHVHSHLFSFFFSWYGKSALVTQFTCSHFKPAVSANTQLLRWIVSFWLKYLGEEFGNSGVQGLRSICEQESRIQSVCSVLKLLLLCCERGTHQLSHTSQSHASTKKRIIITQLHHILPVYQCKCGKAQFRFVIVN